MTRFATRETRDDATRTANGERRTANGGSGRETFFRRGDGGLKAVGGFKTTGGVPWFFTVHGRDPHLFGCATRRARAYPLYTQGGHTNHV